MLYNPFIVPAIRKLIHSIETNSPCQIRPAWQHGPPQKVTFAFLLGGPRKFYNGPVADIHGKLTFVEQILAEIKSTPYIIGNLDPSSPPSHKELIETYNELLMSDWLIAAPVALDDNETVFCFVGIEAPDKTLLADLLSAAKEYQANFEIYISNLKPDDPFVVRKLGERLAKAKIPIAGVALVQKPHDVQYAADFFWTAMGYVRVDWEEEPDAKTKSKVLPIIRTHIKWVYRTRSVSKFVERTKKRLERFQAFPPLRWLGEFIVKLLSEVLAKRLAG